MASAKKLPLSDLVLLCPPVSQKQVLCLYVVVYVSLRVDVLEDVDDLQGQVEGGLATERTLPVLEEALDVLPVPGKCREEIN